MHSAVRSKERISFRMLHKDDLSPIRYERVCEAEGEPVPWNEIVKGYEYKKGKYVVLTDEDFKAAAVESSKTIEILGFVDAEEIDHLAEPFDPSKYHDEYRANLMKIIQARMKGKKIEYDEPREPAATPVINLMTRLQASLDQGRKKPRGSGAGSGRKRAKRREAATTRRRKSA